METLKAIRSPKPQWITPKHHTLRPFFFFGGGGEWGRDGVQQPGDRFHFPLGSSSVFRRVSIEPTVHFLTATLMFTSLHILKLYAKRVTSPWKKKKKSKVHMKTSHQIFLKDRLLPHSQGLNTFKSCLVKHTLNLFLP